MNIQFRIHREYIDVSGFVVSLLEKCEKGFVFQHPADEETNRTHIHGYLFNAYASRKTLSGQIAEKLRMKGNTDFSTSDKCSRADPRPIDMSGAYCYGSKWDTIAPSYLKNISPDLLEQLRSHAKKWTIMDIASKQAPTTSLVILKEIKVKQKPTQYQHVTNIVQIITETRPDLHTLPKVTQRRQIFEVVYHYFQTNELFMGKYKQLDMLDMVMLKIDCSEYKSLLFDDFMKRTSRF